MREMARVTSRNTRGASRCEAGEIERFNAESLKVQADKRQLCLRAYSASAITRTKQNIREIESGNTPALPDNRISEQAATLAPLSNHTAGK
jgi:hypothetical protein